MSFNSLNMNELLRYHNFEAEAIGDKTPVLVSGLPGKMATLVAKELAEDERFHLLPFAITSARQRNVSQTLSNGQRIDLLNYYPFDVPHGTLVVDFTTPQSAEINTLNYTQLGIPFVMGTTGGNRVAIEDLIRNSNISAVLAPNMNVEIVERQIEIDKMASSNPRIFEGAIVQIDEIHQPSKVDISGTAISFRNQYEKHGATLGGHIESIRDDPSSPRVQEAFAGITPDPQRGYAYHRVIVTGKNGNHIHDFETRVIGREVYVVGTLLAVMFLAEKIREGSHGEIFTMRDVVEERRTA